MAGRLRRYESGMTQQMTLSPRAWALLFLLATIWGASFLSNRIALEEVGVLTTVAFRVTGASLALWLWIWAKRIPVTLSPRLIGTFMVMGLSNNVIPFTFIVWGQQHIESGLAAILNGSTAIFTVLLAAIVFADEKLTLRKLTGVTLGFAGAVTAIGITHLTALSLTSLGQLAILCSSASYAVAAIFARGAFRGVAPQVAAAGMLSGAVVYMVPLALWAEGAPSFDYNPATWGALAYLALAASAAAYILYYRVLTLAGAGNLSLVTLLVAVIAIGLGAAWYGEALPLRAYAGFGLLALGLAVIDGRLLRHIRRLKPAR